MTEPLDYYGRCDIHDYDWNTDCKDMGCIYCLKNEKERLERVLKSIDQLLNDNN